MCPFIIVCPILIVSCENIREMTWPPLLRVGQGTDVTLHVTQRRSLLPKLIKDGGECKKHRILIKTILILSGARL